MKKDNGKRLFDALGGIGDDLIEEASSYNAKRERALKIRKYSAIAASLLLIAAIAVIVIMKKQPDRNIKEMPASPIFQAGEHAALSDSGALPEALRSVSVRASGDAGKIISTDNSFIVETKEECDTDTVLKYMNVSPKTNLFVTKISGTEFKVSPASGKLFPGTLYNVSFGEPDNPGISYSFQTESEFFVKSVLPDDMSTNVPVNSGIEITFSDVVDGSEFENFITVEPSVGLKFVKYPNGRVVAAVPTEDFEYGTVYTVTVKPGLCSLAGKELAEEKKTSFMTETSDREYEGPDRLYIGVAMPDSYQDRGYYYYGTNRSEYIFSPGEPAALECEVYNFGDIKGVEVTANLYRYPDTSSAAKAMLACSTKTRIDKEYAYSSKGLEKVGEFKGEPLKDDYYDNASVLSFGDGLERGFYLAEITARARTGFNDKLESSKYLVIQISDLRTFTISSDGKTLVRTDSAKSGAPSGAKVSSVSFNRSLWGSDEEDAGEIVEESSAASENGVCTVNTGIADSALITVESAEDAIIICAECAEKEVGEYSMSYVYTDREKYFSNDTVNFSGFAVKLNGTMPSSLYVKTAQSPAEQIEVDDSGRFSGKYTIEDAAQGGFYITIVDPDDKVVASKYVSVTEEEKPKITASLSFDKLFYRFGEDVTATLKATFFDGTPAEGFEFTFSSYPFGSDDVTVQTTDKNGEAVYKFTTGNTGDYWSTDPSTIEVSAELTGSESQTLYINKDVYYFHSDYVFKTVWERDRRAVTLNKVDTSKIRTEDDLKYDVFPENTVGEPADGTVSYVLKKYEIVKYENDAYDYIAKRTYTKVTYETKESVEDSGTLTFTNGVVELPIKKVEGFVGGYWYEVSFNDGRNTYKHHISATESRYAYEGNGIEYEISLDKEAYRSGDKFTSTLNMNGIPVDGVLFAVYADGLEKYGVGSSYTDTFDGAMLTGSEIYAVYFDTDAGSYVCRSTGMKFDRSANLLEVELETDKERYAPGESATVKIKAKDAPGAAVILSVVDEACFALEEQNEDSASSFFSSVRKIEKDESGDRIFFDCYGWYGGYYRGWGSGTMKQVTVNGRFDSSETVFGALNGADYDAAAPGEALGYSGVDKAAYETATEDAMRQNETYESSSLKEESVYVRTYFADNPVFEVIELDEAGEGTLLFTVPDNITSWRITASAYDGIDGDFENARLGNAVSDVICTKDFFINLSAPSYYIAGDDAALLARSFGVSSDGEVEYSAKITDESGREVARAEAKDDSKGYAELNFGKLGVGHYTATVYGTGKASSDALTSEFDVISCAEIMPDVKTVEPGDIKSVTPALYPVTVTFFDKDSSNRLYNSIMAELSLGDGTARADMIAAQYAALAASERIYGADEEERLGSVKQSFEKYVGTQVSLFTYSKEDPELTCGVLTVAPDIIGADKRNELISYLYEAVLYPEQPDDVTLCASLASLAALNEPILDSLYSFSNYAGNFSDDAKLYLASAFASLGDWSAAKEIYGQLKAVYGEENGEYKTLCFRGADDDETARLTSLALLAASRCDREDASKLAKFLYENGTETYVPYIAFASYVRSFMPEGDYAEKTVTYTAGGEEITETVSPWKNPSLKLSKSSFESFAVISADEGVAARVYYKAPAEDVISRYDLTDRVTVSKTIEPYKNGMYKVTLHISGTSERVCENFDITDAVPSGARFFESYDDTYSDRTRGKIHTGAYVYNPAGQKVSGHVWVCNTTYWDSDYYRTECPEYEFSVSVSYVIRAAVHGEFIAEPAIIRNLGAGIYSSSERYIVEMTDGEWVINKED